MKKFYILLIGLVMLCGCSRQSDDVNNMTTSLTTTTLTTPAVTTKPVTTTTTTSYVTKSTTTTSKITTTPKVTTPIVVTTTLPPIKESGLVQKTSKEILTKIENKETFVVYLGTSTCSACIAYKPYILEFMEQYEDKAIYYVNLDQCDSIDTNELATFVSLEYTPTTFLFINGEIEESFVGTDDNYLKIMMNEI